MTTKYARLYPGGFYHVYNRANGSELLFPDQAAYREFLVRTLHHLEPVCSVLCYCLLPNHFHLLIRCHESDELQLRQRGVAGEEEGSAYIHSQFSRIFNGYAQWLNRRDERKGGLFMRPFKRKSVSNELYLRKLVHYIHRNPVLAGLCDVVSDYEYSSFSAIYRVDNDLHNEVVQLFGDRKNFWQVHQSGAFFLTP